MTLYGLPALPGPAEVIEIGEPWRPYRTLALPLSVAIACTAPV